MDSLPKRDGNYVPLSPVTFLPRAAAVYADRTSVICGATSFTWRQTHARCLRLAASLQALAVSKNDVVSVLAPNTPALYEMHFAVPMAGGVLNAINTRLDASGVAAIVKHADPKLLFVDYQYIRLATDALSSILAAADSTGTAAALPLLVVIDDIENPTGLRVGELEYEQLVARGDPAQHPPRPVEDEWDAVALNYTSGTTSSPKGVVYSHRGAYLSTVGLLLQWGVAHEPVFLWSLPMFHCNGWTFTWGVAARGGANVCVRAPTAQAMYSAVVAHGVTHMCAAPVLFNVLLDDAPPAPLPRRVEVLTGGAPPPAALLERVEKLGFHVTHAYGMTEATGPAMVCEWRERWDALPPPERALLKARQGVSALSLAGAGVKDLQTMASVPRDGATMGEIVLRGSSVMKGYYKDPKATAAAFRAGWFLTGDVGVVHPDGYVEIKDRSKDVIISGGENISSVEVEAALYGHPAVREAAVVAMPHRHWGETPCAFVALKKEFSAGEVSEEEVVSFCRNKMAHFMVPRKVVFMDELPKNATGKVQKLALRERARGLRPRAPEKTRPGPAHPAALTAASRL
ncbi:benzoate--CoA ligase, peroxisomal [Brachypodium distachyon]|uniref:4-coumarate--CoA ligase n=1 Tax=Brachypodium distachyon TaxID=15368 RepID=I1ISP1_BRADI|nr:benzoate--CoA ligase, peroxisomal [Brachypodium distachyon]KQJ91422.1 hypothetical protein BRADI_4g37570v3 [Brachypodium distachyon]|eukprot:XP_003578618.1 benzoate--CoA ligase, peroxisomal [Brachypodium distachyon]